MSFNKVLSYIALAAFLFGVGWWIFSPHPLSVDVASAVNAPMVVSIEGEGQARVREVYEVSAPVSGRIERIEVHVGDTVSAGETLLFSIHPGRPQFLDERARTQAEAAVALAQAELNFARSELKRTTELRASETVSERALDSAKLTVATRAAALDSARAALIGPGAVAGEADCCVEVTAPLSGTILKVARESEGIIEIATPVVSIGNPDDMEVVVDLLSPDAVKIAPGTAVEIVGWGGDTIIPGTVRRIEPTAFTKTSALGIEEQRVNVLIEFADAPKKLGHGYRVRVRIAEWHADSALQIPLSALFRKDAEWAAFIFDDGIARLTQVTIGHINTANAEVLDGLTPGTRVVLHPSDLIEDGVAITERSPQ